MTPGPAATNVQVAIVGAGFAGIGAAIRLTQDGTDDFVVIERAADLGGTWRDNDYPGCACDVPSHLYSFSFAPNPDWTRSFSPQPEIHRYLWRCAERYGLGPHLRLGHELVAARWDADQARWCLETSRGTFTARILLLGTGGLSEPSVPPLAGLGAFGGTVFHSATWDHGHDLAGRRVAVIGTGASAIQIVPHIQPQVDRLDLFQRTPPWVLPRWDRPVTRAERWVFRRAPVTQKVVRAGLYWWREAYLLGFAGRRRLIGLAQLAGRLHLRHQVADGALRAALTPQHTIGCKRVLISNDYYPALTRANVEVHTSPIREVQPHAVVTADGRRTEVDTIILATGFAFSDWPVARRIWGAGSRLLADAWRDGPEAYLGTSVAGFPNLFLLVGPNTFVGHSSVVFMIEAQLAYIGDCLRFMRTHRVGAVEVRPEAQAAYNAGIEAQMAGTVWASGCASWYLDHAGRNRALWPGFTWRFRQLTRRFDPASYRLVPGPPQPSTAARSTRARAATA